jgi:FMN hydrolase / 5-amino-6-(5-phospho-D-ribitylamino)uracil phosphatase
VAAHRRWVCLDVGETLIDETRVWSTWADIVDVPRLTLMAALGAVIARADPHQGLFDVLQRPAWRSLQATFGARYGPFRASDLYPDALPAIDGLRGHGYAISILANQPAERTAELRALGVEAEVMAMSGELGISKPDPTFFARALELMGDPDPADVAYVGDRLDNDVRPAAAAGMQPVWVRRGPWGVIGDDLGLPPETLVVATLAELVGRIDRAWPSGRRQAT